MAETFSVSLFRAEGAELNVPRTAIVTIVDDEAGNGLVAHWRLDETAIGQTVIDSSGNNNSGAHQNIASPNGPTTDAPNFDSGNQRGVNFDGVDDFISIPVDSSLNLNGSSFTQSVWIRPENTDNGFHGILGFQPTNGTVNRYPGIWVDDQTKIHAGFGDGTNWNSFTTGEVLTVGQWNHVATTFDGTSYRAFVNGDLVFATTDFAGPTPSTTSQVTIGKVDNFFQGGIDDVRIYNRALSATEVEVLIDGATVPDRPLADGEFITSQIASGYDTPIEIEFLPDGRTLVAGNGVSLQTGGYRDLAVVQDYYATNPDVTAPAYARLHSNGGRAIVMGDFVSSVYGSVYDNTLIFTDIGDQILRAARFNSAGEITSVTSVSQSVGFIVDIETGLDGFLYYVDITGSVGRLDFV